MIDIATKLTDRKLGRRWTKSETLDRVYLTAEFLTAMGFEIDTYNGGNIRGAKRHGSKISNNQAAEYVEIVTKTYYDVATGRLTSAGRLKRIDDASAILKEVRQTINELD